MIVISKNSKHPAPCTQTSERMQTFRSAPGASRAFADDEITRQHDDVWSGIVNSPHDRCEAIGSHNGVPRMDIR